eukprot:scaffold33569_cov84-Skeletonema_dohrnii-CCMP3373.AAC.6
MEEWDEDDDIFVYMGGDQVVPDDVRRVRIDKSVKIIPRDAFNGREHLIYVEFHDGIERIENWAFEGCELLRGVKLLGVKVIKLGAFASCRGMTEVEFGVELETIGSCAFQYCTSLTRVRMPSVRSIGRWAFKNCEQLTDLEFGEGLETIQEHAFYSCIALRRIIIPLNCVIGDQVFYNCSKLAAIDLVGGIHNTVATLHLESWRNEMKDEINRINQVLPNTTSSQKTDTIHQWVESVSDRMNRYKTEHKALLKEATTLLELALWKAKIEEKEDRREVKAKRVKIDVQSKRNERRIMSGANIVIKNVLPFLELK